MLSFAKIYLLKIEVYKFFQTLNKILQEYDFSEFIAMVCHNFTSIGDTVLLQS